jgi:hypothetical protein
MDKTRLQSIGGAVAMAGIVSIVLNFINFNLRILMWIDLWGEGVGWAIRVALVLIGGAIYAAGTFMGKPASAPAAD